MAWWQYHPLLHLKLCCTKKIEIFEIVRVCEGWNSQMLTVDYNLIVDMHRDINFWAISPLWQLVIYYKKWGWSKQRKRSWGVMLKWWQSPAGKHPLYCHCYHTQTVPQDPWQAQAEVWQQCKRETEPRHAGEPVWACTGAALEAHKENSAPAAGGCWRHSCMAIPSPPPASHKMSPPLPTLEEHIFSETFPELVKG